MNRIGMALMLPCFVVFACCLLSSAVSFAIPAENDYNVYAKKGQTDVHEFADVLANGGFYRFHLVSGTPGWKVDPDSVQWSCTGGGILSVASDKVNASYQTPNDGTTYTVTATGKLVPEQSGAGGGQDDTSFTAQAKGQIYKPYVRWINPADVVHLEEGRDHTVDLKAFVKAYPVQAGQDEEGICNVTITRDWTTSGGDGSKAHFGGGATQTQTSGDDCTLYVTPTAAAPDVYTVEAKGTIRTSATHQGQVTAPSKPMRMVKIIQPGDLWWFGPFTNAANYSEEIQLMAYNFAQGTEFTWKITSGADCAEFDNCSAVKPTGTVKTVMLKSKNYTNPVTLVTVELWVPSGMVCKIGMKVRSPVDSLVDLVCRYTIRSPSGSSVGFKTDYYISVLDQDGNRIPRVLEVNESFSEEQDLPGTKGWTLDPKGGWTGTSGGEIPEPLPVYQIKDQFLFASPLITPNPVGHADAEAPTPVKRAYQTYRAGSSQTGQGIVWKSHWLTLHRGYAEQE